MKTEYIEHIALYHNVFPEGYCEHLINEFNRLEVGGAGSNRQVREGALKHRKADHSIFINMGNHTLLDYNGHDSNRMFFTGLQDCYNDYTNKYSLLQSTGRIKATDMKMQRTGPGEGYHIWHCEQGEGKQAYRVVTYMLYLNDIKPEDGGETEFLYQKKRISPTANTMILWPAAYTHAHRGNVVLGNESKYIVTGWFLYD
jgi:Rps23 Pro-64 3,4-dihydroxylase Tpa1-like proline 4-hydroxylase